VVLDPRRVSPFFATSIQPLENRAAIVYSDFMAFDQGWNRRIERNVP
jgi:hypothetical protein